MFGFLRKILRSLLPFPWRVRYSRTLGGRCFRDLAGRIGAGGFHAFVARGVSARRWRHVRIGPDTQVERGTHFHSNDDGDAARVIIGARCFIGQNCFFSPGERILIADDSVIGAACNFLAAGHKYDDAKVAVARAEVMSYGPMVVGAGCWVGVGTTLLGGIDVGFGAIVAAGSLLRSSVPPLCLAAGHPARVIRTYDWLDQVWTTLPTDEAARDSALLRHVERLPSEIDYLKALACENRMDPTTPAVRN